MANQFASGKTAIAVCDRCGFQFKLKELKPLTIKTKIVNIRVCPDCWEPDQPQLSLGMYPINDPQALRDPRNDNSYLVSGPTITGTAGGGSRVFEWGWSPVGGAGQITSSLTPNALSLLVNIGTVTVVTV
jgi:hypothetical protein